MHTFLPVRAHIVLAIAWTCILLLNAIFLKSVSVGALATFLYALSVSVALRRRLFPNESTFVGLLLGACGSLALFIILSVPLYWIIGWYVWGVLGVMIAMPLIVYLFPARERTLCPEDGSIRMALSTSARTMHGVVVFILQMSLLVMLYGSRVTHAVISPWESIPGSFMPLFALTTLFLIGYYLRRDASAGVFLAGVHAIIMMGVALIVFPLGYGFDPFIHRAAVAHIFEHGVLTPKTPYYIGQYTVLSAAGHLMGSGAMALFDRVLVPLLAPVMLVVSLKVAMTAAGARRFVPLVALSAFLIPFSSFIITTPQALANMFFAVMIVLSFGLIKPRSVSLIYLWLMALAAAAIHPLTGVPALVGVTLVSVVMVHQRYNQTRIFHILRAAFIFLLLAGSSFILPVLLLLNSRGVNRLTDILSHLGLPRFPWQIPFMRPFDPTLDVLYSYRFLLVALLVGCFAYGLWAIARLRELRRISVVYVGLALVLLINAALMASGMPLPLVIDYEQHNYSLRVMEMIVFALIPFLATLMYYFLDRLVRCTWLIRMIGMVIYVVGLSASMYFSYPQNNPVERSHGYTVSQADFDTVDAISEHAGTEHYVVLANQQVSAAAIAHLGFVRYYATADGEQFLYSIPTGGRLYEYFLQMMYSEPSRSIAYDVMDYMGVEQVYVVVSPYWWNADVVATAALTTADESFQLDSSNRVFVYKKNSP